MTSLQKQADLGIISPADAVMKITMNRNEKLDTIKKLVNGVHITRNGKLRSIKLHDATASYPNGYAYTSLKGGRIVKAKTVDDLYERLYQHYFGVEVFTVGKVFDLAIEEKRGTANLTAETIRKNENDYTRFFSDDLKERDITSVTVTDIKEYCQKLVNTTTISKKSFLGFKGILKLIFGYAMENGIINKNPIDTINFRVYLKSCVDRVKAVENEIFSQEEIETLTKDAESRAENTYYVYFFAMRFSILTGCRVGEIFSLKWSDIDFDSKLIHIHSQQLCTFKDGSNHYYYAPYTKNERGISKGGRLFPLTNELHDLLVRLDQEQKELGIKSDYVFVHRSGEWVTTRQYQSYLRRICRKHGLQLTNNHSFRKTLNSAVFHKNGLSISDSAELLGHSEETNLRNYSYASRDHLERARNILNSYQGSVREVENVIPFTKRKSPQSADYKAFC